MLAKPAGLIYGTISVAALLAAESARQETYARTVGAVAITITLYWLAHSYAEYTGERLEHHEHFTYKGFLLAATQELTVLLGAAVPFGVLIACWIFGASLIGAVAAAVWTSAGIVIATEVFIGIRAELTGRELLRQSIVGALLGVLVIALRILLH
jgi:hypothetical protein